MSQPAPAPFTHGIPVPSIIWDSVEETLRANMRRLAKDIAKTLGQSETPLFDALFKGPGATVKPYIFEESDADKEVDMRCDFPCQMPGSDGGIWQTCGQPVVWFATGAAGKGGCKRCTEHLYAGSPAPIPAHMHRLTQLEPAALEEEDGFLAASEDGTVYDKKGCVRGRYLFSSRKLLLFEDA